MSDPKHRPLAPHVAAAIERNAPGSPAAQPSAPAGPGGQALAPHVAAAIQRGASGGLTAQRSAEPSTTSYTTRSGRQTRQFVFDVEVFGDGEDPTDLSYRGRQLRLSWPASLRQKLINAQTHQGRLICAHCNQEIVLNSDGKEEWVSSSGNRHATAPPIDHHNPSWRVRLQRLYEKAAKGSWDYTKFSAEAKEAYLAPTLRILHMKCNSSLGG